MFGVRTDQVKHLKSGESIENKVERDPSFIVRTIETCFVFGTNNGDSLVSFVSTDHRDIEMYLEVVSNGDDAASLQTKSLETNQVMVEHFQARLSSQVAIDIAKAILENIANRDPSAIARNRERILQAIDGG